MKNSPKEMWRYKCKYLPGSHLWPSSHFTDEEGSERLFNDCVSSVLVSNPTFTLLHKTQQFLKSETVSPALNNISGGDKGIDDGESLSDFRLFIT